jgi:RNA polymerase sigma-70 factor (ECF subfamily)
MAPTHPPRAADATPRDPGATLEDLYRDHAPGLNRWIGAMTRDDEAAADLVQEAFLRLARERAAGRSPDDPAAWVAQVARHLAVSRARRASTAARYAPRLLDRSDGEDPAEAVIAAERAVAVRRALAILRPVERAAVVLAAEGVGGPEIATRIGRTQLATRALLCRARRRMRLLLLEADAC